MFTDLRVHSLLSDGVDSPARLREEAARLGIALGLCDGVVHEGMISGVEVRAESRRELLRALRGVSRKFDYVVVHGGDAKINRAASRDSRVDILAHPYRGRRDSGVDAVIARQAAESGVAIEVDLGSIISARGFARVRQLQKVHRILTLSRKYGFRIVATSGAKSRYELRSEREAEAILVSAGFTPEEARRALEEVPLRLLERRRLAKQEISRGVRLVED
ncbi:MAG: ribonuclease P [Euryarchaeota archaeon]|nr:ribonuclease P [Euryarchaeota archaeon]